MDRNLFPCKSLIICVLSFSILLQGCSFSNGSALKSPPSSGCLLEANGSIESIDKNGWLEIRLEVGHVSNPARRYSNFSLNIANFDPENYSKYFQAVDVDSETSIGMRLSFSEGDLRQLGQKATSFSKLPNRAQRNILETLEYFNIAELENSFVKVKPWFWKANDPFDVKAVKGFLVFVVAPLSTGIAGGSVYLIVTKPWESQ